MRSNGRSETIHRVIGRISMDDFFAPRRRQPLVTSNREASKRAAEGNEDKATKTAKLELELESSRKTEVPPRPERIAEAEGPPKPSLLHYLYRRSLPSIRTRPLVCPSPPRFQYIPKLNVQQPNGGYRDVQCLAFDKEGILLAVVFDCLCIYEWDGFQSRWHADEPYQAEPILTIPLPRLSFVSAIQWNPWNEDELAVLAWDSGIVYLFDVAEVNGWKQSGGQGSVPQRTIRVPSSGSKETQILFLPDENILVSCGSEIFCYNLTGATTRLCWQQSWEKVTSTLLLGKNLIAIGSAKGNVMILDWTRVVQAPFATGYRPSIIMKWSSCAGNSVPTSWVAVQSLYCDTSRTDVTLREGKVWGDVRLRWVTSGGWLFSSVLRSSDDKPDRSKIVFSTTPLRYRTSESGLVQAKNGSWSLPTSPVASANRGRLCVWESVSDSTMVLPRHDKYVLQDSHSTIIRTNEKPSLRWMWIGSDTHRNRDGLLQLSRRRGRPTCLDIHPSHQWIVAGLRSYGLYIIHARNAK